MVATIVLENDLKNKVVTIILENNLRNGLD